MLLTNHVAISLGVASIGYFQYWMAVFLVLVINQGNLTKASWALQESRWQYLMKYRKKKEVKSVRCKTKQEILMKCIHEDIQAKRKVMFHSTAGGLQMMLKAPSSSHNKSTNIIANKDTTTKHKRNKKHKEGKSPCPHCGQYNHSRIMSQLCPFNHNYCHKKQKQQHHNNQTAEK